MNVSDLRTHHANRTNITCLDLFSYTHIASQRVADFDKNFFNEGEVRLPGRYKR